ncbi:MAG: hypothetical protein KHY04_06800 [Bifidobacterium catenulatum]|nr:hypothetical protein [Bifidobacterium catenulatum]MBS5346028.1 hypothetical protein [Bifidobacterium catenulatum]
MTVVDQPGQRSSHHRHRCVDIIHLPFTERHSPPDRASRDALAGPFRNILFGLGARRPGNSAIAFHNESRQKIASTNTMDGHYDSSLIDALLSGFILSVVRTIA